MQERDAELCAQIERLTTENADLRRWKALDKPLTAAMSIANSHLTPLRAEIERLTTERNDAQNLLCHMSAEIERLSTTPICISKAIIQILAKEGAWQFANGSALIAADELFHNDPYAEVVRLTAENTSFAIENVSLRAQIERLTAALKPFALNVNAVSLRDTLGHITREDLLRARDAVEPRDR